MYLSLGKIFEKSQVQLSIQTIAREQILIKQAIRISEQILNGSSVTKLSKMSFSRALLDTPLAHWISPAGVRA